MADNTPGGAVHAFAGTTIDAITNVVAISFPNIDRQSVEAYEQLIGQSLPVDLYNSTPAPRKDVFTATVTVMAPNSVTDPVAAWADVMAGYHALAGMPEVGTLTVYTDAGASATVSCQARRKPLPLVLTASNARFVSPVLTWTLLTPWA